MTTASGAGAGLKVRCGRGGGGGGAVTRAYTFPGGCVTQRLVAPAKSRDQLASEASFALGFTTRQELGQALSQRSSGRLTLDAAAR